MPDIAIKKISNIYMYRYICFGMRVAVGFWQFFVCVRVCSAPPLEKLFLPAAVWLMFNT